jgi:hypothetical protein
MRLQARCGRFFSPPDQPPPVKYLDPCALEVTGVAGTKAKPRARCRRAGVKKKPSRPRACARPAVRRQARAYDPARQRFMNSRRPGPRTFWATACLRQARRASLTQTAT